MLGFKADGQGRILETSLVQKRWFYLKHRDRIHGQEELHWSHEEWRKLMHPAWVRSPPSASASTTRDILLSGRPPVDWGRTGRVLSGGGNPGWVPLPSPDSELTEGGELCSWLISGSSISAWGWAHATARNVAIYNLTVKGSSQFSEHSQGSRGSSDLSPGGPGRRQAVEKPANQQFRINHLDPSISHSQPLY